MQSLVEQNTELLSRLQKGHKAFQGSPTIARIWKHTIKHWEISLVAKRAQLSLSKIKFKIKPNALYSVPLKAFFCAQGKGWMADTEQDSHHSLSTSLSCVMCRGHQNLKAPENSVRSLGLRPKIFLIPSLNLQQHSDHGDLHECRTRRLRWHGSRQMILLHSWDSSGTASASHPWAGAHFMAQPQEHWNSCQAGFWSSCGTAAFLSC